MEALQHAFPWVRTHALTILAKRTSPPVPEILSTALRDPHEQGRVAAASAVGNWTANAPIEQLVNVTTGRFENVRFAAARSLGKIGLNDPVKALQGLLNVLCYPEFMEDPNDYRSINLVSEALSIIAPHAPAEPLYQAMHDLHKRNDDWLARVAARVLGEQGARAPIAQLVSDLHSQDANMRMLAVIALGKTGAHAPITELIQALDNPPHVRAEVLRVLCALSAAVPGDFFLQLLRNEKHKHHIFLGLLLALKNTGKPVPSDLLLQALQSNELWPPPMAEELLSYLCSLNPLPLPTPTLIVGLATFLTHYQPSEAAVEKLRAALLPQLPLPALLATLAQKNATIRRGGLILLSYVPDNVPLKPLLTALRDPSSGVRQAAIYCIWVHADRLPVSALAALLQDGNTDVRKFAIKTLAAAGADAPINDLVTLLDDTDYNVQCTAIETLCQPDIARITPVEVFVRALEFATVEGHSNAKAHKMALQVLCDKDPHIAITHCIAALGDSNAEIALTAFQTLQKISPATIPEIVQEATALLEGGKPKHFFRTLSMRFLANVTGDMGQAAPDLIARLGELLDWPYWEVRMKAVQALGKLRRNIPDATIRRLLELRHDPHSRAVREAADEALAEILSLETGIEDD
jgi:HEAT repeat protein